MAPTFDEDNGPGRLRSLWSAGEDLTAAAADRAELEAALAAAQRDYNAALAARSALLGALAGMQSAYAAAHVKAVEAGWSSTELSDAGLPAPTARHSGAREPVRPPVAPPGAPPVTAPDASPSPPAPPAVVPPSGTSVVPASSTAVVPPSQTAVRRPPEVPPPAGPRSSWDAEQTANLVTSRSTDNPVWYESMRYSRISPPTAAFDVADLDRAPWTGLPTPSGPADRRENPGRDADGDDPT